MIKRAIILAGGKGTRLKPFTKILPKPLMPIGKFTILEIVIRQLKYYGFKHITITVNHQAKLIEAFFGDGKKKIQESEIPVRQSARRSLVARIDIPAGTPLEPAMLACKRPGTGIPPNELDRVLGKSPKVAISAEQLLTWDMF